jgi:hypothetical protein
MTPSDGRFLILRRRRFRWTLLLAGLDCSFNMVSEEREVPNGRSPCKIAQDQNEVNDGL